MGILTIVLYLAFFPRWATTYCEERLRSLETNDVKRIDIIRYENFWHEASRKTLTTQEDITGFINELKVASRPVIRNHTIDYRTRYVTIITSTRLLKFVVRDTHADGILISFYSNGYNGLYLTTLRADGLRRYVWD